MDKEKKVYLESLHHYNFRHGIENPKVVGLTYCTPEGLTERLCYKVKYKSDHYIDFIPYSEVVNGNWKFT